MTFALGLLYVILRYFVNVGLLGLVFKNYFLLVKFDCQYQCNQLPSLRNDLLYMSSRTFNSTYSLGGVPCELRATSQPRLGGVPCELRATSQPR